MALILIGVCSAPGAEAPAPGSIEAWGKCPYASLNIGVGMEAFGGQPSDALGFGWLGGVGFGFRYKRATLGCMLQVGGNRNVKDSYDETTERTEESFNLRTSNFMLDVGCQFSRSQRLFWEPFVGIRWSVMNEYDVEQYMDWDRSARAGVDPTTGVRLKWLTHGFDIECESCGYFFAELRLSYLRFDNFEYGKGLSLQLMVGYGGDITDD